MNFLERKFKIIFFCFFEWILSLDHLGLISDASFYFCLSVFLSVCSLPLSLGPSVSLSVTRFPLRHSLLYLCLSVFLFICSLSQSHYFVSLILLYLCQSFCLCALCCCVIFLSLCLYGLYVCILSDSVLCFINHFLYTQLFDYIFLLRVYSVYIFSPSNDLPLFFRLSVCQYYFFLYLFLFLFLFSSADWSHPWVI